MKQGQPQNLYFEMFNTNSQWRIWDFHLGGTCNGQVKKLNNKMKIFRVLFKEFLKSRV